MHRARPLLRRPIALLLVMSVALSGLGLTSSAALGSPSDGHITGIVTGPGDTPLPNVWVSVAYLSGSSWFLAATTLTRPDGRYDVDVPEGGPHRVAFSRQGYATEYYEDATTMATAANVPVTAGVTTTVNAELAVTGHVTGRITGTGGGGVPDVDVTAWQLVGSDWFRTGATALTDDQGDYDLDGLPTGSFRLEFQPPYGSDYLSEWWDDAATVEAATTVSVVGGTTVSGKDAELSADGPMPAITNTALPTINGTAQVGSTLTASTGTWDPGTDLSFSYRWLVNGAPVATDASYVPVAGDIGKTVRCEVTATRPGHHAATATSAATTPVAAPNPVANAALPTIMGRPRVGRTVTATPGAWAPADAALRFQWLVAGTPVAGATTSSYTPVAADVGKPLQVQVTGTATGRTTGTATSAASAIGKGTLKATKKPRLVGTTKRGATLKVAPGRWSPTKVSTTYRWYAGARAIPKSTTAKLELAGKTLRSVAGKAITVLVTVAAPGYSTVSTTLRAPGRVRLR